MRIFSSTLLVGLIVSAHVLSIAVCFKHGMHMLPLIGKRISQLPQRRSPAASSTALGGIPKLFRWLLDLYPISVEGLEDQFHAKRLQIDNFYLDMNGIIHTCTHNNDETMSGLTEQEMFLRIFKYTDQLYKLVNPKKLMYLAVDGVAPRAKMNQQRARRFRAAKDRELLELAQSPSQVSPVVPFDSNCITPGTDFMHRLSRSFHVWIEHKIQHDPMWQHGAEVVFSGPDVPGEGEHKIMDKIRHDQEIAGKTKQSLRHCMYGLDADLIMLGLVTREPQFVLLRENQLRNIVRKDTSKDINPRDFEILEVPMLRRMLKLHIEENIQKYLKQQDAKSKPQNPFPFLLDIDRVIDDFVFM
jgi:5'-3' exoribonuclease 1